MPVYACVCVSAKERVLCFVVPMPWLYSMHSTVDILVVNPDAVRGAERQRTLAPHRCQYVGLRYERGVCTAMCFCCA